MDSKIPFDMKESAADVIGRKIKIAWMQIVRYELKPEKFENKILVLTDYRLMALAAKVPTKVEQSVHFLDIQTIESKKNNQVVLTTFEGRRLSYHLPEAIPDAADTVISHIGTSLRATFPGLKYEIIIPNILVNEERMSVFKEKIHQKGLCHVGPCGGFSATYACMCDYHHLPFMEDVAWDVDTIYLSQDSREFCLGDFDHLESKNLVPLIAALEHNCWFTKLNATNIKLNTDACNELLKVVKSNAVLEELWLCNNGLKWDFAHRLSQALMSNARSPLTTLDLSYNLIEDRGVTHLCGPISKLSKGLKHINLSKTGISSKGVNKLADAMNNNAQMTNSLTHLDLSDNYLKGEEITNLYTFLAHTNSIKTLSLSGTECALEPIFGALLQGCCKHLAHLDLSKNTYFTKRTKESAIPLAWKHYFASTEVLEHVNLSENKLPPEAAKNVLLGISANRHTHNVHLDLSCNDFRASGANILEICFTDLHNVTSLDISDNGFDMDLERICQGLAKTRGLKRLAIGKNFNNVKQKHLSQVLDAVVHLMQEEESTIEALSLADSKLKTEACIIINGLGSNSTLKEIDLSGNYMGDLGARMLAKALQLNNHLHTVYWDKNGTSATGFQDIAAALRINHSMKKMPVPIQDATLALKTNPEKVEKALQQIEMLLQRNHSPRKFSSAQAYRLQQGLLISASQQMVDHLTQQIHQHVASLQAAGHVSSSAKKDIDRANQLIKDADKSKQLLLRLQEVATRVEKEDNEIEASLQSISDNLQDVIEKQLKSNMGEMLNCSRDQCPTMMNDSSFQDNLKKTCTEKSTIPQNFSHNLIVGHVSTDVMNKLSEVNLAVASHMSDSLIDAVLDSLDECSKKLRNYVNNPDALSPVKTPDGPQLDDKLLLKLKDKLIPEDSPYSTLKKKTLNNRRLRPQSVIDANEVKKALQLAREAEAASAASANETQHANEETGVHKKLEQSLSMETLNESEVEGQGSPRIDRTKEKEEIDKGEEEEGTAGNTVSEEEEESTVGARDPSPLPPASPSPSIELPKSPQDGSRPASQASIPSTPGSESLPDFGSLTPETAPKLDHLVKSRPKRFKTHAPSRATVRQDSKPDEVDSSVDSGISDFFDRKSVSRELVTPEPVQKENDINREKNEEDRDSSLKKKGWSPFGGKADSKSLAAGISNFFSKKSPSQPKSPEAPKRGGSHKEIDDRSPVAPRRSTPSTPELRKSPANELEAKSHGDPGRKSPALEIEKPDGRKSPNDLDKPSIDGRKSPARGVDVVDSNKAEETAEEEEEKKPAHTVPKFGLPGIGGAGGASLLAEMRAKRATMKSMPSKNDEVKDKNRQSMPSSVLNKENRSPTPKAASVHATSAKSDSRPTPIPRSRSPVTLSEKPQEKGDDGTKSPVAKPRPAPPVKPKPPSIAPKPRAGGLGLKPVPTARTSSPPTNTGQGRVSAYGSRMSDEEESK